MREKALPPWTGRVRRSPGHETVNAIRLESPGAGGPVGVQQPSSAPHIEAFDDRDLFGPTQEDPAVAERDETPWRGHSQASRLPKGR